MGMSKIEFMTQYRKDKEAKERKRLKELKDESSKYAASVAYSIERSLDIKNAWSEWRNK